jgi:pilus assembly protein FimV
MARETQSSPAGEKRLEQYGVWVKVKPREVALQPAADDAAELSDLESVRTAPARAPAAATAPVESSLTAEEEQLLDELETELGPSEETTDVLVPEEEPLLDDEGELPDIDSMTESAEDGEKAEEELPELEEEPVPAPRGGPRRARAEPSEIEVTLTDDGEQGEQFDDLEALESELASVSSTARTAASSSSSEILSRIEEELRSIRTDLTQLRSELSGLKNGTAAAAAASKEPATGADTQSGFFDEDEDETIALTGDELDNILNTADITEESSEAGGTLEAVQLDDSAAAEEIAPPLDDILSLELEEAKPAPAPKRPAPAAAEVEVEELELADDTLIPLDDTTIEELPAEMVLEELTEPAAADAADLEELPELDLEGIPEIEAETPAPAPKKAAAAAAADDEGDETIDLETLDLGEEPTVIDAVPAEAGDLAEDVDLEALQAEIDEETGHAPTAATDDLEIGELESIGDEAAPAEGETGVEIEFESGEAPAAASAMEELGPADLGEADQILDAEEVLDEEPAAPAAVNGESVPDNLKDEIRTVLRYMDHLLEALPDEKIQEFAGSDYFVMYKKLFEDLGLGE